MPSTCSSKALPLVLSRVTAFLSPMRSHGLQFSVLAHIANTRTQTPFTHSFLLPFVPYNFYSIHCNKHSGFSAVLSICMCGMCVMCTCVSACTLARACEDLRSMLSVFVYCSPLCIKTGSLIEPGAHHLAHHLTWWTVSSWAPLSLLPRVGITVITRPHLLYGCENVEIWTQVPMFAQKALEVSSHSIPQHDLLPFSKD